MSFNVESGQRADQVNISLTKQGLLLAILLHVNSSTLGSFFNRFAQLEQLVEVVEHKVQDKPRVLEADALGLQQAAGKVVKQDAVVGLLFRYLQTISQYFNNQMNLAAGDLHFR